MPAPPESRPARYLALLYSPGAQRSVLEALFGIEREVSDSLRPGLDHHVAHSRLQWWREECGRAAAGRPVHPVARALVEAVGELGAAPRGATPYRTTAPGATPDDAQSAPSTAALAGGAAPSAATPHRTTAPGATPDDAQSAPSAAALSGAEAPSRANSLPQLAGLSGFVDVVVWDLAGATFETRRELTAYCERWAAAMIEPLVAAPASATRANNWRALGAAMREIELLADLPREAHYGRLRVPLDELEGIKADPSVLAKPPWPPAVADLLRARHKSLRDEIARALEDVDARQQPAVRGLLVWAALACRTSQRAERALPDQLLPGRFDAIADPWFAWRMARRAITGRFRLN